MKISSRPLILSALFFLFLSVFGSFLTLDQFPPLNFDEVGNAVLADSYGETGKIIYPLMKDVIDPAYQSFSQSGQTSLRGVHIGLLSWSEKIFGVGPVRLRFISYLVYLLTLLLTFFLVRKHLSTGVALLSTLFLSLSLDFQLASHLIRPDMLLAFWVALILFIGSSKNLGQSYWRWVFIGLLSGLAVGIHPHGLILIPFSWLFLGISKEQKGSKLSLFGYLILGLAVGLAIWGLMSDFPTYAMSQHSYVARIYDQQVGVWQERLVPWTLVGEMVRFVLSPESFYFHASLQDRNIWMAASLAQLTLILFSLLWIMKRKPKNLFLTNLGVLLVFVWIGLAFGHFRTEYVYNCPLTLLSVPLVSWVLVDLWGEVKKGKRSQWILIILGTFLLSWVFRYSLIYFFLFMAIVFALVKARDRFVLLILGLGLFVLFSITVQGKPMVSFLNAQTIQSLKSYWWVVIFSLFLVSIPFKNLKQTKVGALLGFSLMIGCLLFVFTSSFVHIQSVG